MALHDLPSHTTSRLEGQGASVLGVTIETRGGFIGNNSPASTCRRRSGNRLLREPVRQARSLEPVAQRLTQELLAAAEGEVVVETIALRLGGLSGGAEQGALFESAVGR